MGDKRERARRVRAALHVVSGVHASVARGSGKGTATSRQSVRIVQRDGETVVNEVSTDASCAEQGDGE